ncbi:DUF5377 family protein [Pasteurella oralis]|uniref:DUF5377 family protein n=1 Tax=Pasteurella oralis TaxID=1071947 RepID=UPI000C7A4EF0|nr:DUF5377 family protein [Pasteurella oralis]
MTMQTKLLFSNNWNVRISDPGEEGTHSHFFETIYITLAAHIDSNGISYEFTRKIEDQVKTNRTFTDLAELFKFLGDYVDPVSMGFLGIKIGNLGVQA